MRFFANLQVEETNSNSNIAVLSMRFLSHSRLIALQMRHCRSLYEILLHRLLRDTCAVASIAVLSMRFFQFPSKLAQTFLYIAVLSMRFWAWWEDIKGCGRVLLPFSLWDSKRERHQGLALGWLPFSLWDSGLRRLWQKKALNLLPFSLWDSVQK